MLAWASRPGAHRAHPLTVRLVKGAYWDHEIVQARQHGWSRPVFEVKADCDLNFEELTRRLIDARGRSALAVGSHNLRSVAHAVAYNRLTGGEDADLELQVLRGLGDPLQEALAAHGLPRPRLLPGRGPRGRHGLPRAPAAGEHEQRLVPAGPGAGRRRLDDLAGPARPPREAVRERAGPGAPARARARRARRRPGVARRASCRCASGGDDDRLRRPLPARTAWWRPPPRRPPPTSTRALDAASAASRRWRDTPAAERAAILVARRRRPARAPAARRRPGAARVRQAVARGRRRRLRGDRLPRVLRRAARSSSTAARAPADARASATRCATRRAASSPSSRRGTSRWRSRSAWRPPALATGNAVVLKPAEQSPGCALLLRQALARPASPTASSAAHRLRRGRRRARRRPARPHDRLHRLQRGRPRDHPRRPPRSATGQHHLKRVVAEMGGKNAVIVDSDADLDEVVPALISSAFTFAGQKCSAAARVLVHESIHDALVERLAGAIELLEVAPAERPPIDVPAVIEAESRDRHAQFVDLARPRGPRRRLGHRRPRRRLLRAADAGLPTCRRPPSCCAPRSSPRCSPSSA